MDKHRNITRMDYSQSSSWYVRIMWDKKKYTKTFNDNKYEYEEIALPFLKNLGLAIYKIELERQRNHEPDLSLFRFPERKY